MRKEIEINGCIEISPEMNIVDFENEFIKFVESNGWSFGGGFKEIVDGYYVMPDGSKGKSVSENWTLKNKIKQFIDLHRN